MYNETYLSIMDGIVNDLAAHGMHSLLVRNSFSRAAACLRSPCCCAPRLLGAHAYANATMSLTLESASVFCPQPPAHREYKASCAELRCSPFSRSIRAQDMHQDVLSSKYSLYDGAPLWVVDLSQPDHGITPALCAFPLGVLVLLRSSVVCLLPAAARSCLCCAVRSCAAAVPFTALASARLFPPPTLSYVMMRVLYRLITCLHSRTAYPWPLKNITFWSENYLAEGERFFLCWSALVLGPVRPLGTA